MEGCGCGVTMGKWPWKTWSWSWEPFLLIQKPTLITKRDEGFLCTSQGVGFSCSTFVLGDGGVVGRILTEADRQVCIRA